MSSDSQRPLTHGPTNGHAIGGGIKRKTMDELDAQLKMSAASDMSTFHGDELLADKQRTTTGTFDDLRNVFTWKNAAEIGEVAWKSLLGQGLDVGLHFDGLLLDDEVWRTKVVHRWLLELSLWAPCLPIARTGRP